MPASPPHRPASIPTPVGSSSTREPRLKSKMTLELAKGGGKVGVIHLLASKPTSLETQK